MGLREVKRALKEEKKRKEKGKVKMIRELEQVISKFSEAIKALEEFEKKWGEVEQLKDLQERFKQPLDNKKKLGDTFWGRLSGKFYLNLAFTILSILKEYSTPIVSLSGLLKTLHKKIPTEKFRTSDVKRAIRILEKKKLINGTFTKGNLLYIEHEKVENDIEKVFKATEEGEKFRIPDLLEALGWSYTRTERILEKMVELGILVKEEYPPGYWIPK